MLTSNWTYEHIRWPFKRFVAMRFRRCAVGLYRAGNWCVYRSCSWTPCDGKGPAK